jgi:nitric oxide reductase activation protein
MLKPLTKMIEQAEGEYLSADQLSTLQAFHANFGLRAKTYQTVQQIQEELITEVSQRLRAACPGKSYDQSKCARDAAEVLRHCSLAMLLDDRDMLYDDLLHWLKTIMVAIGHLEIHRLVYPTMQAVVKQKLKPAQAELLNEYLAYAQSVMQ